MASPQRSPPADEPHASSPSAQEDGELRDLINKVMSFRGSLNNEEAAGVGLELWPEDAATRTYEFPGVAGTFTLQQLVLWEIKKDPKIKQIKRKLLPTEFWNLRRRVFNRRRTQRNKERRGMARAAREAELSHLTEEERARLEEERRQRDVQAHLEQQARFEEGMASGMDLVVDCRFCQGLNDREIRSLCKQLQYSYGLNRRAKRPARLQFASFTGPVRDVADRAMNGQRWPVLRSERPALELFPLERVVVLSPDAEQPLLEVDPAKVYVVGGLVDRSVQKGATLSYAEQGGVAAARLPIAEFLPDQAASAHGKAHVLNIHDVVGALLAVHGGDSWEAALRAAIPPRKRAGAGGQQQQPARRRRAEADGVGHCPVPASGSAGSEGEAAAGRGSAPAGDVGASGDNAAAGGGTKAGLPADPAAD